MKQNSCIFAVVGLLSSALFFSCSSSEDLAEETPLKTDSILTRGDSLCSHDSLTYYAAEAPTETVGGNVECYLCEDCGRFYADETCTTEIESPILWGTNLVLGAGDYYKLFDKYYTEGGYKQELTSNGAEPNFIIAAILKKVLVSKAEDAVKKMFNYLIDDEKTQKKVINPVYKQIADNVAKVERAILGLSQMFKEEKIKDNLNDREQKVFYVRNATHPYFMSVLQQLEGVTSPDNIPADKTNIIKSLVNEWYSNGIYNGLTNQSPYLTISELLHFYNGFWTSSKSFPELYDQMAYKSMPWYHQTLPVRLMTRYTDVASLSEGYLMLCLYYHYNSDNSSTAKINLLNNEMSMYDETLEAHPVDTDTEYARWIWTNKQALNIDQFKIRWDIWHFTKNGVNVIDQQLDKLIADQTSWDQDAAMVSVYNASVDNGLQHGLSTFENQLIYKYYKSTNFTDYYAMLDSAGFQGVTPFDQNGRLVCWDNKVALRNPHDGANRYTWQYDSWLFAYCSNKDGRIVFRTALNKNCTRICKATKDEDVEKEPFRVNMDWSYYNSDVPRHPDQLKSKGQRGTVNGKVIDFEALVKNNTEWYKPLDFK